MPPAVALTGRSNDISRRTHHNDSHTTKSSLLHREEKKFEERAGTLEEPTESSTTSETEIVEAMMDDPNCVPMSISELNSNNSDNSNSNDSRNDSTQQQQSSSYNCTNDFFADSPYFTAFVEQEIRSIDVYNSTIRDIIQSNAKYVKAGDEFGMAMRRLAMSYKLQTQEYNDDTCTTSRDGGTGYVNLKKVQEKRNALGTDMANHLGLIGELLDEVAIVQQALCKTIDALITPTMLETTTKHLKEVQGIRDEVIAQVNKAEKLLIKYVAAKHPKSQ